MIARRMARLHMLIALWTFLLQFIFGVSLLRISLILSSEWPDGKWIAIYKKGGAGRKLETCASLSSFEKTP